MRNEKLNETIKRIVNQDILVCQSMLVDGMLKKEVFNYDDIENMYVDNSSKIEELNNNKEVLENEKNEKIDNLQENNENEANLIEENFEKQISGIDDQIEELEGEQEEPQEAYEWWVVSEWLEGKLRDNNEILLVTDYGTWWGRQTTGQAIEMDYIMEKIAQDIQ